MNDLVYRFTNVFSERQNYAEVNYLCKDNFIHIRLRRFGDRVERISGFESKLTFLITLLMLNTFNQQITTEQLEMSNNKNNYQEIWKSCLESLKSSGNYKAIETFLTQTLGAKGIKILPAYSLKKKPKNAYDLLGKCNNFSSEVLLSNLIDTYINPFGIAEYLYNDNLEISIEKRREVDNSKFINKYKDKSNDINLWEM